MSRDSQASFSQSARNAIHEKYRLRCVICLNHTSTAQCAHIFDAGTPEQAPLRNAIELGILPADYQNNAAGNGLIQCPTCHAYLTQNFLALSLPIPILEYIRDYVRNTPKASRKPLREVFELLVEASQGTQVELPDAESLFPYLGLFTLVTLNPARVVGDRISTLFVPRLSIIRGNKFVKARSNASPTSKNVARIFEPLVLDNNSPLNPGVIPISPDDQAFTEKRYWRMPVSPALIFAALIDRLRYDFSGCQDIRLVKSIQYILSLQSIDEYWLDESDGNGEPSGGGGPRGSGEASSKRKDADGKSEFPPRARYRNQQYDHCDIVSSTYIRDEGYDAPAHSISGDWQEDSDFENGHSVSATTPQDEDNPAEWQFGPSFSTNKIVFTARGVNLT